jgi:hypothetical protein
MKTFLKVYVVLFFGFISLNTFSQNAERFPANARTDYQCKIR